MRELLFKNLTSQNSHMRELYMSETVTSRDMVIETQRRSAYFIKHRFHAKDLYSKENIKMLKEGRKAKKQQFYIVRKHDSKTGEDKISYKLCGFLYVVMGEYVYLIAFINSFKIGISKGRPSVKGK